MHAHDVERLAAEVDEVLEALIRPVAAVDHVRHVGAEHERHAVPAAGRVKVVVAGSRSRGHGRRVAGSQSQCITFFCTS